MTYDAGDRVDGAALIRREDLDREETKLLLFPDIQKYLKPAH